MTRAEDGKLLSHLEWPICMYFRGWPHMSLEIGLRYDAGGMMLTDL